LIRDRLGDLVERLEDVSRRYHAHFTSRTRTVIGSVKSFLRGIFLAERRNMQQMAEVQESVDRQSLQYLVSEAKWDHQAVQDQIAQDADRLLGGFSDSMLLLDETAYGKKGKHSAGVARQWNGRLGKVDNCQVGVFAALCRGTVAALVQSRLYLPDEWVKDGQRCKKAGIPVENCELKSKSTLALELVARTRQLGLRYAWVGADAGYGKEPRFLRSLADAGERFMVDVHRTQRGFLQDPKPSLPAAESTKKRGRQPSRLVTHQPVLTVEGWAKSQPASAWQEISVRHTTLGLLRVQALRTVFWLWDHEEPQARRWTLLVVRELENPSEISFSLTNADESLATQLLVQVQRQRFWIENAFGDAKSEIGLADYEVRTWTGWHRHMTLCMLAQLFTIEQRFEESESIPMLSTRDVRTLLSCLLSGRRHLLERFCQTVADRQRQRWKSIVSRYLKQGEDPVFLSVGSSTM